MAAAVITFFVPGLRFFHEGQLEGRKARVSMHLGRRPVESSRTRRSRPSTTACCPRCDAPRCTRGSGGARGPRPAWAGKRDAEQFIAGLWESGDRRLLTVVNYGDTQAQCYLPLDVPALRGRKVILTDQLGDARYEREGEP